MAYLDLFWSFFRIGLFSFGGGYAMVTMIRLETVQLHDWISAADFVDLIAISEMTPGPIGINSATFIGYQVGGVLGSAVATVAIVLPSLVIVSLLTYAFVRLRQNPVVACVLGVLRPVFISLIAAAAVVVLPPAIVDIRTGAIGLACLALLQFTRVSPLLVLAGAGVVGALFLG
jgi:chromate transporter